MDVEAIAERMIAEQEAMFEYNYACTHYLVMNALHPEDGYLDKLKEYTSNNSVESIIEKILKDGKA